MLFEKLKLEDDEKVIAIVRKHWWNITIQTLTIVFFAVIPFFLGSLLLRLEFGGQFIDYATFSATVAANAAIVTYLYGTWLLFLWMILANFWTDQYLDLWAITTRRVILVDQRGFFRRFISSFRLERLQDMNIEISGVIPTLLDFGTIEAQTAGGSNEEFISQHMPKPRDIKAMIVSAADDLTQKQAGHISSLKEQGL